MTLETYNPNAICIKCGCDHIGSGYRTGLHYPCSCYEEHICRYCRNCGYSWPELTLDSKVAVLTACKGKPTTIEFDVERVKTHKED